jgi:hypothetical protein
MNIFLFESTESCHNPDINLALVLELKEKIKTPVTNNKQLSSTILHSAMRSSSLDWAGQLSKNETLLRTIRLQRQVVSINPDEKLLDYLKQTDRVDDFVLHEDKNLIPFTTDTNLSVLKMC